MESLKENLSQVKQSLKELENLYKDGKDQHDATVKATEETIRLALNIPRENWINTGQPLKVLVESLQRQLDILQSPSCSTEMISDKDVMKNASGGLALEGIYKTSNLEDLLEKREQLIAIPESLSLTSPKQDFMYEQKEFSSSKSQSIYEKVIQNLGFSLSTSLKIGYGSFSLGSAVDGNKLSEKEDTHTNSHEESYILQTKYNYIPLACCFIEKEMLLLSDGAINALKEIEMLILHSNKSKTLRNKVKDFYERFGSHVNQGPIHFGGIFQWRACAAGFSSSDLSEMKKLTSDALNAYIGAGYGVPFLNFSGTGTTSASQLTGSFTRKHKETLISQVQLSVSKTGGPAEVDNHLQWKYHLATSNKTWSVIDRGTTLIPIWEILTATHKDDFKDAFNLSRILMETYTDITKLNVEQVLEEDLCEVKEAKILIQSVKNWSASECESHLTTLLKLKTRLLQKTGSHNTWILVCLSDQILQNYLLEVTTVNKSSKILTILMQNLLEPDLYEVENFPNRSKIMNWIHQKEADKDISVSELSELYNILQHARKELEDSRYAFSCVEEVFSAKKNATSTATVSLNSWCKTLRDNDQKETELLIVSIATVLGYNTEVKTFDHVLDLNEINFLLTKLQDAFSRYSCLKEQCATRAQAYLFLTALTLSTDEDIQISNKEKRKRLQLIQTQLKDNIFFAIKSAIENSQDNWQLLEKALYSIEMGTHNSDEHPMLEESVFHLENVLRKQLPSVSEIEPTDELNTSGNNTAGVKMDSFMHLLEKLGLSGSYPKKMMKKDVLVINSLSLSINEPTTEKELSNLYLYKLMILDYQARYLCVKPEAGSMSLNDGGVTAEDDEDFFDIGDKSIQSVSGKKEQIHSMDIHMAIFHCSNDCLRQYIFTKLSASQFGLPILVPSPCTEEVEFPLWALRHITRSWQSKNGSTSGKYNSRQMFNTSVPIVSFIRLGSSNYNSKSQILNGVISKQRHSVFFHRHCRGSTSNSLLMNGVAEIAWYCPGGKKDDIFDDCVAFLNLHGDAAEHPKQLEFLQAVSTVNVLLLSEHAMSEAAKKISQELCKSPVPLICLFSGKEHIQQSTNPRTVRIAAKNRNQAELTDELASQIKQCICLNKQTTSLEGCSTAARKLQFKVDEDNKSCQDAYSQAKKLTCLLKKGNVPTLKERFLPLQGELWHHWCIKDKEQYRLRVKERESLEQQSSRISAEMTSIRLRQLETPLNEFMRLFFECLTSSVNTEDTILYRLQWLRILLDDISTEALAKLEEDYLSAWRKMREVQKDKEKATHVHQMQSKLSSICDKMVTTTVGLQHIMREVGQLYEANQMTAKVKENTKQYSSSLPDIGVKMLLSGYPLELMDGDTAHVPVKWIEAVLEKLTETCGDKKLFVLSILGLQSSGKSTLLNTMFGVQFSVSAGRCTRGAFMQLIPVDSSIRNQLGYDFVLIVDTEGLRSPELSTKQSVSHDNELATFVIGIGDMTVINIMGENASEMHDILQICVQAFLRMKQVKISPGCIFVHQNCAEASAGDKNMEGRRRLLEKLDDIAQMAAKEENIEGITDFNDVINFDIDTQVFYFKNLLEGDPPMAPLNPSYSQNVQELKTKLLTLSQWQANRNFPSLSEFKWRVCDLWQALLQENFVFSFRNTVEMMVYSALEVKYAAWSWKLIKHALDRQTELRNKIGSSLIQDITIADLDFDKVYNSLQSDIEMYFKEDENKETRIKWKENIIRRFEILKGELIDGTLMKCQKLITSKRNRSELVQMNKKYTEELTEKSKALASKLKILHLEEEEMKTEFDKLWVSWTAEVLNIQPPEDRTDVKAAVEKVLLRKFETHPNIIQEIQGENRMFEFDTKRHIQQNILKRLFSQKSLIPEVQHFKEKLIHNIQAYITAKEDEKNDFDKNFIHEILSGIEEKITAFEKEKDLSFTNAFKVDLSVHLCLKYVSRFQRMHDDFKTANQPLTYLQSQRDNYLQSFKNYCKGASSVTIFAEFFCKHIKPEVLKAANDKVSRQIADEMKTNNQALNGIRSNLEKHVLKHLAEKECFESYEEYLDYPERYFEKFIQENVERFCADIKLRKMYQDHLETLKRQIITASTEVTTKVAEKKGSASMWLTDMCENVGKLIVIDRDELHSIQEEHIEDWQFLKDMMAMSLEERIKDEKEIDVNSLRKTCTSILFQQLQGCWEQCPFCKAICTNTIPNHDGEHSVMFHRCDALAGWHYKGTDHFSINFCTTAVSSYQQFIPDWNENESIPYKTYRKAGDPYNKWNITPDGSVQRYWKWFICQFQEQLENKYKCKFVGAGAIPNEWKSFTKESALAELV